MGAYPQAVDFDNDGKLDLVAGDSGGAVRFFKNSGTAREPVLEEGVKVEADGLPIGFTHLMEQFFGRMRLQADKAKLQVVDFNEDGKNDLVIAYKRGSFLLYLNSGEKGQPTFPAPVLINPGQSLHLLQTYPCVVDWNLDGLPDLLLGDHAGRVYYYENTGSAEAPEFKAGVVLCSGGREICIPHNACVTSADWNNDGKPDLLLANHYQPSPFFKQLRQPFKNRVWLFLRK